MVVNFAEKYKPLFEVLEARTVTSSPTFKKDYNKSDQEYWIKLSKVETVLISGGRDSGKTFGLSCFNPIASKDYDHRILYTRQTMSSTDNSITEALEGRMELLGYEQYFESANKTYSVKKGVGKISITGQKTSTGTQTAKLKSLEDYSIFITDEGEELESYDSWNKVKRSMRASDVQCLSIISFNPPTREHWMFEEFYEDFYDTLSNPDEINGIRDNILYIHSTYLDNIDNMAEHNVREYEELRVSYNLYESLTSEERENASLKLKKKWKQYKFEILGAFKDIADGVIFEDWEIGEFNKSLSYVYGMDFGFDDPDVIVKIAVDESQKKVYIDQILNQNGLGTNQLAEIMIEIIGYNDLVIADAAHKRLISDLYERGINIKRCRKGGGSVLRNIKTLQGYTLVITKESIDAVKAMNNYVWHDKRAGVPKNEYKHFPDAIGYAAMELIVY